MRGFSIVGQKERRYTFAYTKDKVFHPNLEGIGGERHFYTRPGENTVEYDLSSLESDLAPVHQRLIDGEFDPTLDSLKAAELLAHASLRAKLLRFEMSVAIEEFRSFLDNFTKDRKAFARLLKQHLADNPTLISADPRAKLVGGDLAWIDDVLRDHPELALQFIDPTFFSLIDTATTHVFSNVDEFTRSSHLKLLNETLAPTNLIDRFQSQHIRLLRLDTKTLVFGDSIVFYLDKKGRALGGLNVAGNESAICLPISPNSALISAPFLLDHRRVDYLGGAIRSSLQFFIYPTEQAHLRKRTNSIGSLAGNKLKAIAEDVFSSFLSA